MLKKDNIFAITLRFFIPRFSPVIWNDALTFACFHTATIVDEKNGGVNPYNETEAYARAGHYGATVVSPGFNSSYVRQATSCTSEPPETAI
ncbi:hypothetical protein DAPPUDRAFT_238896 [Daphnia pulex]|uniref:Uncharacterized protein n=1 Tax=Daphnia pulex TaxID=6669 RepID=E9G7Q6_DAPPU|nr:hypothetical protein DAPPUDRAFT_238896 [Daphnia pulex]|eukprot:EFX84521.1 hypothetical protein DAPPUDRAFT_238896 [Daphnia pulex]